MLVGTPSATRNSTVVERVRKAEAVIVELTNLVEFAYSGIGSIHITNEPAPSRRDVAAGVRVARNQPLPTGSETAAMTSGVP